MTRRQIELLQQALELDPVERQAFVDEACGEDPELRATLLRLLALDAKTDVLLDRGADRVAVAVVAGSSAADAPEDLVEALQPGDLVGPWRILECLGSGGMGSVWLAEREDGAFGQTVALKCIKPGMDSAAVLRSFQRERELLVHLEHPGIAHLIDGGIDARGRPWYAMRHVEGVTLDHWLQSAPPLRTRLELFLALCRIVAYAHRQLVIHRDLKPGNVMVQPDGTPCLLDFGIAKILRDDESDATATVAHFASRAYAAPEQIEGTPVSTATDVYALGAILFELLTGIRYSTVRDSGTVSTGPSQALRSLDTPPRTALPALQLKGDLDAITLRAVAPDPTRRYLGADALADDVQRHLAGLPVQARPDGAWYRASKWMGRNRLAATGLLIAVIALVAGTGVSLWQAQRATLEAQRANTVKKYLIGLFDAGRTNSAGAAALERRVIDVLDDSAARLKDDLAGQPELRDEIYTILVEIYDSINAGDRSIALAQERLAQANAAFGADDVRVAPALLLLAGVHLNHDHRGEVAGLLDRAETLLDAAGERDTLSRALLLQRRARQLGRTMGDSDVSLGMYARANDILRRHYPESDDLIVTLFMTAQAANWAKQPAIAYAALDELRERARNRDGEQSQPIAQANFMEARLLLEAGDAEHALERLYQARKQFVHFAGENHNDVLVTRFFEVQALLALDRVAQADAAWRSADAQRGAYFADNTNFASAFAEQRAQIDAALARKAAP